MKLTADARSLADALSWVSTAIPNRPTTPALAGALLEATEDGLTVAGHDYDNALRAQVENTEVGEPGTVLVPGRALAGITAKLKGAVTLEYDGTTLNVTAGRNTYRLSTMPVEEYPDLTSWFATDPSAKIDAGMLRSTYEKITHAAGTDDTLPVLTAVRITADGQELTFTATDRYRLGMSTVTFNAGEFTQALVPAKVLHGVVKGLHGQVAFGTTRNLLTLADARKTAAVRLMDGQFPPVEGIRKSHGTPTWKAAFNATAMGEALGRLLALDNGRTSAHPIRLEFSDEAGPDETPAAEIRVTTHHDVDHQGAEYVSCDLDPGGHPLPIVLQMNPQYLLDGINAHGLEDVWIGSATPPTAPVIIGGHPALFEMTMPQRTTS